MVENFIIIEATETSLDSFISLLEEVGQWLWEKGIKQWPPGTFRHNQKRLAYFVSNGCLILAYHKTTLAGGCVLSDVNLGWPEPSKHAMYLNSLGVARFAAGQGLGAQIIDFCDQVVCRRGKSIIRLDCWDENSFLKSYYQSVGFTMLPALAEKDYFIRLFEKGSYGI